VLKILFSPLKFPPVNFFFVGDIRAEQPMSAVPLKRNYAYNFDTYVEANPLLKEIQFRTISTPLGGDFFLLISPDGDDDREEFQLNWDDSKLSVAPGATAQNQIVIYFYHTASGTFKKWKPKEFTGNTLHYGMWTDWSNELEHKVVLRQYCKPKRNGHNERFIFILFNNLIHALNPNICSHADAV